MSSIRHLSALRVYLSRDRLVDALGPGVCGLRCPFLKLSRTIILHPTDEQCSSPWPLGAVGYRHDQVGRKRVVLWVPVVAGQGSLGMPQEIPCEKVGVTLMMDGFVNQTLGTRLPQHLEGLELKVDWLGFLVFFYQCV